MWASAQGNGRSGPGFWGADGSHGYGMMSHDGAGPDRAGMMDDEDCPGGTGAWGSDEAGRGGPTMNGPGGSGHGPGRS